MIEPKLNPDCVITKSLSNPESESDPSLTIDLANPWLKTHINLTKPRETHTCLVWDMRFDVIENKHNPLILL